MKSSNRVVYLLGAGATQGEVSLSDPSIRLLMEDIKFGILFRIRNSRNTDLKILRNQLATQGIDVEHLITLYEASGTPRNQNIAKHLKRLFRLEIQTRLAKLGKRFEPTLISALIDMHEVKGIRETLGGVLTLNYEDLLERGTYRVLGGVNYVIEIGKNLSRFKMSHGTTPILKLHGSFNWRNDFPVSVVSDSKKSREERVLWIPPGVEKRREKYPFSLIWGRAREILVCDTLRIVGCSLSRNDWELISLLYSTQSLTAQLSPYKIELVDFPSQCDEIASRYPYLEITKFLDIEEIRRYYISHTFPRGKFDGPTWRKLSTTLNQSIDPTNTNVFEVWLRAKGEDLVRRNIDVGTSRGIFKNFIEAG